MTVFLIRCRLPDQEGVEDLTPPAAEDRPPGLRGVRHETRSDGSLDDRETHTPMCTRKRAVRACGVCQGLLRWRRDGAARGPVAALVRGSRRVVSGAAGHRPGPWIVVRAR